MTSGRNTGRRDRDRALIRRSGAGCGICGKPIDYSLHYLEPMAFVVDHVIPIVHGGADEIGNKQAAHRACNAAKGKRVHAPIVRRSSSLS